MTTKQVISKLWISFLALVAGWYLVVTTHIVVGLILTLAAVYKFIITFKKDKDLRNYFLVSLGLRRHIK